MTWLLWVPPLLGAIGVGILAHTTLAGLNDVLRLGLGHRRRVRSAIERVLRRDEDEPSLPSEEELYGLPRNLAPWMLLAAAVGLALTWTLLQGPAQALGLAAGCVPLLWKRRRLARARQDVRRQVASLIEEVRLRLAFSGSLGPVLDTLAAEEREGIVHERLRLHRDLVVVAGPEEVLEKLAGELRSPELRMLLRRVRAARRGGASYAEALQAAADEVAGEIARRAEIEVEGAPMRLLFPMLVFLFPPILVLVLYPPAARLIEQLTGAGPGGLGF
jgi:Flp pilus assembly protein TadB